MEQKPGLVVSKLDSRYRGRGFESHHILDGNGYKAMPGLNPVPNHGYDTKKVFKKVFNDRKREEKVAQKSDADQS